MYKSNLWLLSPLYLWINSIKLSILYDISIQNYEKVFFSKKLKCYMYNIFGGILNQSKCFYLAFLTLYRVCHFYSTSLKLHRVFLLPQWSLNFALNDVLILQGVRGIMELLGKTMMEQLEEKASKIDNFTLKRSWCIVKKDV